MSQNIVQWLQSFWQFGAFHKKNPKKNKTAARLPAFSSILTVALDGWMSCTRPGVRRAFDLRRAAVGHLSHFRMFECFLSCGDFVSRYNSRPTLTFERSAQMPDESGHDRTPGRQDALMFLLRTEPVFVFGRRNNSMF